MDDEKQTPETPYVYTLKAPVDGVTEVTLRELTADEIAQFRDDVKRVDDVRAMKNAIAKVTRLEVATVGKMGARDFNACSTYLGAFFG